MRRFLLITIGVIFVVWIFYIGITWGPRPIDAGPQKNVEAVNTELVEESKELARQFEAIAASRAPDEQELGLLREALAKQRAFNLARPPMLEDRRRQEELEARLAHFEAKAIHEESIAAEKEAERLLAAGQVVEAVEHVQVAFDLQRRINQNFGRSGFRDAAREGRLQQQVASMEAEPLHQRSLEAERQAKQAIEKFQWDNARELLTEARDLQGRINESSRRSAYHNTSRYQQLGTQIGLLRVGETMSEVLSLQEQGQKAEKSGQWERAAQQYERAMVLQNQINREHPQSPYVSTERVAELDTARQSALSAPQALELEKALNEMRTALVAEKFTLARERIAQAGRLVAQLFERFPRSRHTDFEVRLEIEYLDLVQTALPELQELLLTNLLPLPGTEEWQMSAAPVSQLVYWQVMKANPSRNIGDELPVDSVTFKQANDFCRRASWILARPVQLPERAHFNAALGEWDQQAYAALSWHKENSEGTSKAITTGTPNPHGFLHLVGNLRVWLDDTAEGGSVWTAGASYEEEFPPAELFQLIGQNLRTPTVGFRYIVGQAKS